MTDSAALKEKGNELFKRGDYAGALDFFSSALELCDQKDAAVLFCNRSACYANLQDLTQSIADAKHALSLDKHYQKAYYRLVRALTQLGRLREARQYLLIALKDAASTELQTLESELDILYGSPLRPKPGDFDILGELGDGNFSKVYKAALKGSPEKVYAIKVIELMTVERMQRRHRNINNEIHMEKRVLNKLDHPNIVTLHATFRDYGSLYYQMEYLQGGEVFQMLFEHCKEDGLAHSVGMHFSLVRFIMAESINALEYMHRCGIVHRDVKPENMMLTASGHVKFVDFGTAKDLEQTDLNGPEFVGTPDYMSPLAVSNKSCGPEADLWALGVVMFQLVTGVTPFGGASPYMAFLKIKRGLVRVPLWAHDDVKNMMSLLLTKDPVERLTRATSVHDGCKICYDKLRGHDFFCAQRFSKDDLASIEGVSTAHSRPAVKVPKLSELCLRAVGQATLLIASHGGAIDNWMTNFDLVKLSPNDRGAIAHYLNRCGALHSPSVHRFFHPSLVDARCIRVDPSTREFIGFTRANHGAWEGDFFFSILADPQLGIAFGLHTGAAGGLDWEPELARLKQAVVCINRLRPRFVVVMGDFTHATPQDDEAVYVGQVEDFRKTMARVSDSIPVLFLPGNQDAGDEPTISSMNAYRERFGADYFGFWYGGVRCLLLNSTLLLKPAALPFEAAHQDAWFAEEIEQAKLGATHVLIFTHHPWFLSDVNEDDSRW